MLDNKITAGGDERAAKTIDVNACGLQCPGPIFETYKAVKDASDGDIIEVRATDPGFQRDIGVWCEKTGNRLISTGFENKSFVARIEKTGLKDAPAPESCSIKNGKTMVVFSGDLDKALASFIIANGAAAMGRKITMFFTFWGLNILRKPEKQNVRKDFLSKMFGAMMPRGTGKLPLSKMNMAGMGPKMIRHMMKKKNVDSLDTLIRQALDNGVDLIACTMSMDIMGIREEELIDGVRLGGVATFLGSAEESDMSLFI